jgi:LAO/AO transport system kinase
VQPDPINPGAVERFKGIRKTRKKASEYTSGILAGDLTCLSQAITLVESSLPDHQSLANEVVEQCLPKAGGSIRIGITGVPGVGKSTFIENFGLKILEQGRTLAVLAIDPTSERSRGSILGDKTRMEELGSRPGAFIRPSPSAGSLGGVARKTREAIFLCEAAGFDTIIIETVGVGQSETAVHSMVDFFLLLMLAGAGDELQGIKRGIMEMADAIAITKADGDNLQYAEKAKGEYERALHLFPPTPSGWKPRVLTCSALANQGIDQIWGTIRTFATKMKENGRLDSNRKEQALYWMFESIDEQLKNIFYQTGVIQDKLPRYKEDVVKGRLTSYKAAKELLRMYFKENKK